VTVATLPMIIGVVLSFRRVDKGPDRRPQSARRQRFVKLRSRGWSIIGAASSPASSWR
jgi:transposase, IS30 family